MANNVALKCEVVAKSGNILKYKKNLEEYNFEPMTDIDAKQYFFIEVKSLYEIYLLGNALGYDIQVNHLSIQKFGYNYIQLIILDK